jgi:hypothetical protein
MKFLTNSIQFNERVLAPFLNAAAAFAIGCLVHFQGSRASAAVPQLLNFQGRVAVDGIAFEGTGWFKFTLVNGDGSVSYWSNDATSAAGSEPAKAVSLPVSRGLYSAPLGDTSLANMAAVPASVFANGDVRLRVWFDDGSNGFEQITPDQRIAAVGYAMVAESASVAQGVVAGGITDSMIAGATISADKLADGVASPWVEDQNGISFNSGATTVSVLRLPQTTASEGIIWIGTLPLIHAFGTNNFFAGPDVGNFTTTGQGNTGVGGKALFSVTDGYDNTATGYDALRFTTTGFQNTSVGNQALRENTVGVGNSALGSQALRDNQSGIANTGVGVVALSRNVSGTGNTAVGRSAMQESISGSLNVAVGGNALFRNSTGSNNTAIGESTLVNVLDGSSNLALGFQAGFNLTGGSDNIYLGHPGQSVESNTIRIGTSTHARTFMSGIRGVATAQNDALPVVIDSVGQLGTPSSWQEAPPKVWVGGPSTRKVVPGLAILTLETTLLNTAATAFSVNGNGNIAINRDGIYEFSLSISKQSTGWTQILRTRNGNTVVEWREVNLVTQGANSYFHHLESYQAGDVVKFELESPGTNVENYNALTGTSGTRLQVKYLGPN